MAFSSTDLASVESAIVSLAKGERVATVTIDGESTEYTQTTLGQLMSLRDRIKVDTDRAASISRYTRLVYSKGY